MPKLEEIHQKFAAAFNAGDADALTALYTHDAVLIPTPGQVARGKAEIRAALEQFLGAKPSIQIKTTGAVEAGNMALAGGEWVIKGTGADGKPFEMSGKSAEVLQRQSDGSWLYVIDNPFS
jgi:uncharacterized protein (TIGR02246 family)